MNGQGGGGASKEGRRVPTATPSPPKRARPASVNTPSIDTRLSLAESTPKATSLQKKNPFALIDAIEGMDTESHFNAVANQVIAAKQEQAGDNVVLTYKDPRNLNMSHLVRIPQNSTDASFRKYSAWLDRVVDINGSGDTKASAKRIAKHLHRKYTEAFEEFLEEEKLVVPGQMNEVAVAAMFAAGGVTGKHQ